MRLLTLVSTLSLLSFCVGCGESTTAASPGTSSGDLTNEQLTAALGIRHWKYTIPNDIGDKTMALKIEGGPTPTKTGAIGEWKSGDVVTICVRSLLPNNALECTIISDRGYSRSVINNSFLNCRSVEHTPNGSMITDGPLIKGNLNSRVSMTADVPGDVSLVVSLQSPEEDEQGQPPATPDE